MYKSNSSGFKAAHKNRPATKQERSARMVAGNRAPVVKPPYPPR